MLPWLNVAGVLLNLLGGWILASILILNEDKALDYGTSKWASKEREVNLRLPLVRLLLAQSRRTIVGMSVVSLGYVLQIVGNWPVGRQ